MKKATIDSPKRELATTERSRLATSIMLGIFFFSIPYACFGANVREQLVPLAPASRWSIGGGIAVRSVDADFKISPSVAPASSNFQSSSSLNDNNKKLFTGGSTPVVYDDGQVGPAGPGNSAMWASGIVNSHSQIVDSGRPTTVGGSDRLIYNVSFHTYGDETITSYKSSYSTVARTDSLADAETGASPFFVLRYSGISLFGLDLSLVTGYSWFGTELDSGNSTLAKYSLIQTQSKIHRTHTYIYDGLQIPNGPFTTGSEPIIVNTGTTALVYNSSGQPVGWNTSDPRQVTSSSIVQSHRTIERDESIGHAGININLHEIPIGIEIGKTLGKVGVSAGAGPTLNVIHYQLTSSRYWQNTANGTRFMEESAEDSDTPVKVGCYGEINIQVPLIASGAVYLEAGASYRWVDSFKISDGITDTELDLSSWEGRIGINIPL